MRDILIVVDMQNDFVSGALAAPGAEDIVKPIKEKILSFDGDVIFTRDTHHSDYLLTEEGKNLPVTHCVENTPGWEIVATLTALRDAIIINKPTFGSVELGEKLRLMDREEKIGNITLLGLCTDICVISNALLVKAFLPDAHIAVDASLSKGVTEERHKTALEAMRSCQIEIKGE